MPRANSKVVRWEPRRVRDLINVVAYGGQVQHQGVVTEGTAITPLVSREDAEAARAILADPSRRTSPGNVAKHLLSNIAICGECGGPLVMMRGYRCGNTNGNHVFIRKDVADSIVIEEIGWRFLTQGTPHDTAHESNTIRKLLSESAELSTRRTQVTELAMMPGIDMARIRRELSEIDALSLEVGESIARERGQLASADLAAEVKRMWAEAQADNGDEAGWPEFWASLGIERQREILRTSFRITIHSARKYPKSPSRDVERLVVEPLS
nr:hypothetical protein GCM10025699_47920 [Microbacterium flavescens]